MTLPTPNLDDRDFLQLMEEAVARIRASTPEWTDLGPGDPGRTLLEVFAHLTEVMLYRLNRVPEKAFRSYLNLIGVQRRPPAAAVVTLRFRRSDPEDADTEIPIPPGTRIAVEGGDGPVFVVLSAATVAAGSREVDVRAHQLEPVEAELLGHTTGQPAQVTRVQRPPIVRSTLDDGGDIRIAVEVEADEPADREVDGRRFRDWLEVDDFADLEPDAGVFVVDRADGTVTFPPAGMGLRPAGGRQIRAWYRTGGGSDGNVGAGLLTTLIDPVPGLEVTNAEPATGGADTEAVESAIVRGPQEFHARERAVTARDYEIVARRAPGVSRASAVTRVEYWSFAPRGEVEVVIVPEVPETSGPLREADLASAASTETLEAVTADLARRRPLGTSHVVRWARYKPVAVSARIAVRAGEDADQVRERVTDRLHRTVNPLPSGERVRASQAGAWPGWPFGQPLRTSDVYDILLGDPGVSWADRVALRVGEVPDRDVAALAADQYQHRTSYAGSGHRLFRSMNDGSGWELLRTFTADAGAGQPAETGRERRGGAGAGAEETGAGTGTDEPDEAAVPRGQPHHQEIVAIEPYPREPARVGMGQHPGLVAVATGDGSGSGRVYVSSDLGESWGAGPLAQFDFEIEDLAWIPREDSVSLLIATDQGLYEQSLTPDATPLLVGVVPEQADLGCYQVVTYSTASGELVVLVAAQEGRGVHRSTLGGADGSFVHAGLEGEDIRTLHVAYDATSTYLWAGAAAGGGDAGRGCWRARLEEAELTWQPLQAGWQGGSCWSIATLGSRAYAASHLTGVVRIDMDEPSPEWSPVSVASGLPLREVGRFHPVRSVDITPGGDLLAGGPVGVFRSRANPADAEEGEGEGEGELLGERFSQVSKATFDDAVTLPPTWLFVSDDHDLEVVHEHAARGD